MSKISPELQPKEGSYYYKRHSEHAGFSDVLAKANAALLVSGKIEEAKIKEGEIERQEAEEAAKEAAKEEEEARKREKAQTVS